MSLFKFEISTRSPSNHPVRTRKVTYYCHCRKSSLKSAGNDIGEGGRAGSSGTLLQHDDNDWMQERVHDHGHVPWGRGSGAGGADEWRPQGGRQQISTEEELQSAYNREKKKRVSSLTRF